MNKLINKLIRLIVGKNYRNRVVAKCMRKIDKRTMTGEQFQARMQRVDRLINNQ